MSAIRLLSALSSIRAGLTRSFNRVGLSVCLASSPLASHAGELEIVALASTDWIYHGTTETGGNPTVGLSLDWQATKRSFVGIEVHQAEVEALPQRHRSFLLYAGTGLALGDNWYTTATVAHREFPGSAVEWDFTEFRVQLDHVGGWGATLDYSPNYYEHDTQAVTAELHYRAELSRKVYLYGALGAVEFGARDHVDYRYAKVGAGVRLGQVVLDVGYLANSEGDNASFGGAPYSEARFIGQLSWRLR